MDTSQICRAFAPNVSWKNDPGLVEKRGSKASYRGYKGVGLTFLAYGTDEIWIHSKKAGTTIRGRMGYGRAWARGEVTQPALMVANGPSSPLDKHSRGTYVRVQFSDKTRPKSLSHLCANPEVWSTILRTRTAIGQVLLGREASAQIKVQLTVVDQQGKPHTFPVEPVFLFPHEVGRTPPFRFLNLVWYHEKYPEQANPPSEQLRQDGLYLVWDTAKIGKELLAADQERFIEELGRYSPCLYAFLPYQGLVWLEINQILSGVRNRNHLYPGLA